MVALGRGVALYPGSLGEEEKIASYPDLPARPRTLYVIISILLEKQEGLVDFVM